MPLNPSRQIIVSEKVGMVILVFPQTSVGLGFTAQLIPLILPGSQLCEFYIKYNAQLKSVFLCID